MNDVSNIVRLAKVQEDHSIPAVAEGSIALTFADRHADELRYVASWGRWLTWNGVRWVFDDTLSTFDRVLFAGSPRRWNRAGPGIVGLLTFAGRIRRRIC